jgi:hypothetical protein
MLSPPTGQLMMPVTTDHGTSRKPMAIANDTM